MADHKMLGFFVIGKEMPFRRSAGLRSDDFREIYDEYAPDKAAKQASRCSQCCAPYCQTHCPLHNNIPDWLRLTAAGRLQEVYELCQQTNTIPEICVRIYPQDRLRLHVLGVTAYQRNDRAGGLLTYRIPGFKLEYMQ